MLRGEGLGKVKITLASTNTSLLLDILEGCSWVLETQDLDSDSQDNYQEEPIISLQYLTHEME